MVCGDLVVFQFDFFTIIHANCLAKFTIKMNVQDLKEFKQELSKACDHGVSQAALDLVFDNFGEALGNWINKAEKHEDHWHGQMHGGLNVKMRLVPESQGTDPQGNDYTEPEHFAVFVSLSKKAIDGMEAVLGKPVKNG